MLLDMDGPCYEFDKALDAAWGRTYPDRPVPKFFGRANFDLPQELQKDVYDLAGQEGFTLNLALVDGCQAAYDDLLSAGHRVFFCSTPLANRFCAQEKIQAVLRDFGHAASRQVILTKDKTLVRGNILIDDKPKITGLLPPTWEHVIYDVSFNRHVNGKRRIDWSNWKDRLPELWPFRR